MRVTPLNQYQLVDIKPDPDLQLASTNNRLLHGCTSCICFGRAAIKVETPSHLKVGPTTTNQEPQPHDDLKTSPDSEKVNNTYTSDIDLDLDDTENKNENCVKSSLKKPATSMAVNGGECKNDTDTERRKVQWTDVFGGELFEIREFEPSEHDDDESDNWNEGNCSCKIM
ncbi:hypothetical protein LXL04_035883 [Taraxacum kok-saghyz]